MTDPASYVSISVFLPPHLSVHERLPTSPATVGADIQRLAARLAARCAPPVDATVDDRLDLER